MNDRELQDQLIAAQLANTQLENEKLAHDLATLRRAAAWYHLPLRLAPLVTVLISVVAFLWGVVQYGAEQKKNRTDREEQSLRERDTSEREFMKPWLNAQRSTYAEALSAAATIANTRDSKIRSAAEQTFWQLYHGQMILVETKSVSGGMKRFGRCVERSETCSTAEMNERARALASAMAESMAATAQMSYRDFSANQFKYTPPRLYAPGP
jgi:hypothetical protein